MTGTLQGLLDSIQRKLTEEERGALNDFASRVLTLKGLYEDTCSELEATKERVTLLEGGIATAGNFLSALIKRNGGEVVIAQQEVAEDADCTRRIVLCNLDPHRQAYVLTTSNPCDGCEDNLENVLGATNTNIN